MLGIKYELIQSVGIVLIGSVLTSIFSGFTLLKFYEELTKGIREKSRLRIWSAFFMLSFTFFLFFFAIRIL